MPPRSVLFGAAGLPGLCGGSGRRSARKLYCDWFKKYVALPMGSVSLLNTWNTTHLEAATQLGVLQWVQ